MKKYIWDGIFKNNPVLVLMIGLCPTVAVSTTVQNALGMGVAVLFVLTMSNLTISLLRPMVPESIRIPIFIIVISTFVTITDYVMHAYAPAIHKNLGIFVPLIVVNCIILGRAEAFASKHTPLPAILDGIGSGIGFTLAILGMAIIRELLGSGKLASHIVLGAKFVATPILFFSLPPGAFLAIAVLIALTRLRK